MLNEDRVCPCCLKKVSALSLSTHTAVCLGKAERAAKKGVKRQKSSQGVRSTSMTLENVPPNLTAATYTTDVNESVSVVRHERHKKRSTSPPTSSLPLIKSFCSLVPTSKTPTFHPESTNSAPPTVDHDSNKHTVTDSYNVDQSILLQMAADACLCTERCPVRTNTQQQVRLSFCIPRFRRIEPVPVDDDAYIWFENADDIDPVASRCTSSDVNLALWLAREKTIVIEDKNATVITPLPTSKAETEQYGTGNHVEQQLKQQSHPHPYPQPQGKWRDRQGKAADPPTGPRLMVVADMEGVQVKEECGAQMGQGRVMGQLLRGTQLRVVERRRRGDGTIAMRVSLRSGPSNAALGWVDDSRTHAEPPILSLQEAANINGLLGGDQGGFVSTSTIFQPASAPSSAPVPGMPREPLRSCPMCMFAFPAMVTQHEVDAHVQQCLASCFE